MILNHSRFVPLKFLSPLFATSWYLQNCSIYIQNITISFDFQYRYAGYTIKLRLHLYQLIFNTITLCLPPTIKVSPSSSWSVSDDFIHCIRFTVQFMVCIANTWLLWPTFTCFKAIFSTSIILEKFQDHNTPRLIHKAITAVTYSFTCL